MDRYSHHEQEKLALQVRKKEGLASMNKECDSGERKAKGGVNIKLHPRISYICVVACYCEEHYFVFRLKINHA